MSPVRLFQFSGCWRFVCAWEQVNLSAADGIKAVWSSPEFKSHLRGKKRPPNSRKLAAGSAERKPKVKIALMRPRLNEGRAEPVLEPSSCPFTSSPLISHRPAIPGNLPGRADAGGISKLCHQRDLFHPSPFSLLGRSQPNSPKQEAIPGSAAFASRRLAPRISPNEP